MSEQAKLPVVMARLKSGHTAGPPWPVMLPHPGDAEVLVTEIERQAKEIERLREALWMNREYYGHVFKDDEHVTLGCPGCAADAALNEKEPRDADA